MKYLVVFFLFIGSLFACSGDCLSCHPVLSKSLDKPHHKILNSCISCHSTLSDAMSECGGDCFSCHSKEKLTKTQLIEHQELSTCKECHIDKEELLKFPDKDFSSNLTDILK